MLSLATARDELTTQHWHLRDILGLLQWTTATWVSISITLLLIVVGEASYQLVQKSHSDHEQEIANVKAKAEEKVAALKAKAVELACLKLAKLEFSVLNRLAKELQSVGIEQPLDMPVIQPFEMRGRFHARYQLYLSLMAEASLPISNDPLHSLPGEQSQMRLREIRQGFTQRIESLRNYQLTLEKALFVDKPIIS
jgi:hypothetical protein